MAKRGLNSSAAARRYKRPLTVIHSVFLACGQYLRVEKRSVGTALHIINNARLEIDIERPRNVFARTSLREECLEAAIGR